MLVIGFFVVFAAFFDGIAVAICSLIERYSEFVSLIAFLGFFVLNFIAAWQAAVYVIERYCLSPKQLARNEEHIKWVESLFGKARR